MPNSSYRNQTKESQKNVFFLPKKYWIFSGNDLRPFDGGPRRTEKWSLKPERWTDRQRETTISHFLPTTSQSNHSER